MRKMYICNQESGFFYPWDLNHEIICYPAKKGIIYNCVFQINNQDDEDDEDND